MQTEVALTKKIRKIVQKDTERTLKTFFANASLGDLRHLRDRMETWESLAEQGETDMLPDAMAAVIAE